MKKLISTLGLVLFCIVAHATTVTINASSRGYTDGSTKTAGSMSISTSSRGYAIFNMSSASIPAAATITSVKVKFTYTISGSGTPTDRIYGYVGDISSLSAASLYSGAVTSDVLYSNSWGTSSTTKTMSSTAAADTFIKHNYNGTISLTWVESASSRIYSIAGGATCQLIVTYTCTTPSSVSITASSNPICSGSSETLTGNATGGATYSWAGPNGFTSTVLAPASFTTSTASAGIYTFTATSTCNISTSATLTLTVKTTPATTTGSTYVCTSGTTTLSNTGIGGTWSSSNTGRATVGSSTGVVTGVTAGSVRMTYTTGCGSADVYSMTVKGTPSAITGTPNVCIGNTTTLSDATSGGTWSSSNSSVVTINSSTGVATGVAAGTATITYNNSGCGIATTSSTVAQAPGSISGSSSLCVGLTTTLTNATSGGTWSASNARATVNSSTGVVTGVSSGAVTISYSTGCGSVATLSMTINASPNSITGTTHECSGSTTTLSSTTAAGTWSSSDNSIATVTAGGVVRGVAAGIVSISYTKTGCSRIVADTVLVAPAAIGGSASVCSGSTTSYTNSSNYGTWSSSNSGVATVSAAGLVGGVAAGSATITYTTGCGSAATKGVTVITTPAAIGGTPNVCEAATTSLTDANGGGTWSSSDNTIASVNAATGVVTGVAQGSATITYSISGCYATTTSNVTGIPRAIGGTTAICNGYSSSLTNTINGGTWSSSNTSIATVDATNGLVTSVAVGSANITYSTGCGSAAVAAVSIDVAPTSLTAGATAMCTSNTTTITPDVTGGSWTSGSSSIASVDGSGTVYGMSEGSTNISYSLTNGCGTTVLTSPMDISLTGKWLGTSSTDWNDAANWPCATVPDATIDVLIPAGTTYLPDFSAATFTMKGLTVASTVTISVSADAILDVKGSLTNNGIINGDGYVNLSGATAQTINGKGYYSNVTLANSNGASITAGDTMFITSVYTNTAGTLTTNGGLALVATASAAGRIAQITGGNISGDVQVQQYITGGRRAYRFLGHPFSSFIALSQLTPYIDITGTGGSDNGFTSTNTNAASCFWYNTTVGNSARGYDPGWASFGATNTVADSNKFNQWQGIRLFYRGAKGEGLNQYAYTPSATIIKMHGPVNQGNQEIVLRKGTNSDYNQISNPYASPTEIGTAIAAAKTANKIVGAAYYVWNPFLGSAGAFEAKAINTVSPIAYNIDMNTSFQVRAAYDGATLSLTEANKVSAASSVLLKGTNSAVASVSLKVVDGNNHPWDMTYINFDNAANSNDELDNDADKQTNPDLNFYTLSADHKKLSIDARPLSNTTVIPMGFTTSYAQRYTIKAEDVNMPAGSTLYLHDKMNGTYTELVSGAQYSFDITADANTQGENRFELTASKAQNAQTSAVANNLTMSVSPNPATENVSIRFNMPSNTKGQLNIMNTAGVSVVNRTIDTQNGAFNININNLPAGIYMVELQAGNEKMIEKLVKQ